MSSFDWLDEWKNPFAVKRKNFVPTKMLFLIRDQNPKVGRLKICLFFCGNQKVFSIADNAKVYRIWTKIAECKL